MSLDRLFRDELEFLRLQGKEFAKNNPSLTHLLSEEASDPDVERLLEGFAFLSARLRHKIEDDFPELTHSILNLLWPDYLRPFPSTTIMQFLPVPKSITKKHVLEKGMLMRSRPVDGTPCQFTTVHDLSVYPLEISSIKPSHSKQKSVLKMDLKTMGGLPLNSIDCDHLPVHLSGSDFNASTLYLWVTHYLDYILVSIDGQTRQLNSQHIETPGFLPEESLLHHHKNTFDGYRILQEFLIFPRRFYFFDLVNLLSIWGSSESDQVSFEFHFTRPLPTGINVYDEDFALHCVPAVNLFQHDADPIMLDGKLTDYPLRPSGNHDGHYEVFSIDKVSGWSDFNSGESDMLREYSPFESFQHEVESAANRKALYYRNKVRSSLSRNGTEQSISFIRSDESNFIPTDSREAISIQMTCTNRNLPEGLAVGDVCIPTEFTPSFVEFSNITRPTASLYPVLDGGLHWQLISNLSLNYLSLLDVDSLRTIINAYDFRAHVDIQSERASQSRALAIKSINTRPIDILLEGLPIRGLQSTMEIDQEKFLSEGQLYLFGTVLSHFFALYSSINSFHKLEVINTSNNEKYTWKLQNGRQPVI